MYHVSGTKRHIQFSLCTPHINWAITKRVTGLYVIRLIFNVYAATEDEMRKQQHEGQQTACSLNRVLLSQ